MKRLTAFILSLLPGKAWAWGIAIISAGVIASTAFTIDYMEYATDGAAQTAYVTSDATPLQAYSEPTIKTQGNYALKIEATADALNETLTKTLTGGDILDLTGLDTIKFDAMSTETGSNLEINIHDTGGTTSTYTIDITSADTFQEETWDISGVADANKDAIDQIQFEVVEIGPQYPPAHSDTYVKATSIASANYYPYFATDPAKSLIDTYALNSWLSDVAVTNQRFHIDLGSSKVVSRLYYENQHSSGAETDHGVQNFTLFGSNEASAFAELTYSVNTNWTEITGLSQTTFDEHDPSNTPDPKYITISGNATPYRYYALKFADNYGDANYMGVRHIELQEVARDFYIDNIRAE